MIMQASHGVFASGFRAAAGGIPTDYIAYYTMTNVSGSTLVDETGTYDMTISGAVVSGDYMDFDGSNDYCESTAIPALSGDCAVCFWIIPDAAPNGTLDYPFQQRQSLGYIHDHSASTIRGTALRQKTGGSFDITTPKFEVTETVNPTFVLVMVDGSALYNYTGDTLRGQVSVGTYASFSNKFNIGCGQTNSGADRANFFPGRIKAFRIYDRALTSGEITALASEF